MKRRTTLSDVAKRADVSPKTVSRVLNDEPHVRADIRERVKRIAHEMNYHPNLAARGLIHQRSFLIGLTYERPSPSYVVELQRGALDRLRGTRYRLMVLPFNHASEKPGDLIAFLRSAGLDGVLLAPPSCDVPEVLDALDAAHIAHGRISPVEMPERGATAGMDDRAAAREIARHLIDLGHRRIAILAGQEHHAASGLRMAGYRDAFAAAGIEPLAIEQGDFTLAGGQAAARRLLALPGPAPTALLAQNDDMAVGAIQAARDAGLSVPEDISVAGFDDAEIARLSWPRLTTMRQPVYDIAHAATDGLLHLLAGEPSPPRRELGHELVLRQSTAVPPPGA